jgi:hypothetical protein
MSTVPTPPQSDENKYSMTVYGIIALAVIVALFFLVRGGASFIFKSKDTIVEVNPGSNSVNPPTMGDTKPAQPAISITAYREQAIGETRSIITELETLRSELYTEKKSVTRDTTVANCESFLGQFKTIQSDFQTNDSTIWKTALSDFHKLKPKAYALLRKT